MMNTTTSIEKLLTVEDVMANLRISRPTLYRLLKSGHLTPVRIGKRTLFDPTDIRAFVVASKQPSSSTEKKPQKKTGGKKTSQPRGTKKPKDIEASPLAEESPEQAVTKPQKTRPPKEKPSADDEDRQGRLL